LNEKRKETVSNQTQKMCHSILAVLVLETRPAAKTKPAEI